MLSWLFPDGSSSAEEEEETVAETGEHGAEQADDSAADSRDPEEDTEEQEEDVFLGTATDHDSGEEPVEQPREPAEAKDSDYMTSEHNEPDSSNSEQDISNSSPGEKPVSTEHAKPRQTNGETGNASREVVRTQKSDRPRQNTGSRTSHRQASSNVFMELPDQSVTETEDPDEDASVEKMLPTELPGWQLQKTDEYRWKVPSAEEWITATYVDPLGDRYMVHISKWQPKYVQYVVDELYRIGKPTEFDTWTARGRFVFAVKIDQGTVDQAKTLLAASPPLSDDYLDQ